MSRNIYANELPCNAFVVLNALAAALDYSRMNRTGTNLGGLMAAEPISENELSRRTGVPQPTIHRILKGKSADPRHGSLRPLADYFRVSVDALRTSSTTMLIAASEDARNARDVGEPIHGYEVRPVEGPEDVELDREVMVAEVNVVASGGPGAWVPEFVETKYRMAYQLNWFAQVGANPRDVRLMKVHGDSMERTLFDGDRIAVNTADRRIRDGRVYVFMVGGVDASVKVKRLFQTSDGRLRIVSDNPDKLSYPDEFLDAHDVENLRMIGRVIDRSGRGGL